MGKDRGKPFTNLARDAKGTGSDATEGQENTPGSIHTIDGGGVW